jgi:RNA polymerase sigma-70 factor (ECF subfamily)
MAGGEKPSDQVIEWIEAARGGSREALGRLLDACRAYLLVVANRNLAPDLGGKVGGSDLVQETLLEALRDFGRFEGRTEDELLAWLCRILLHNLANVTRQYRDTGKRNVAREVPLPDAPRAEVQNGLIDPGASPSARAVAREQAEELERVLAGLPEHYRTVIRLRHLERRPFAEVGRLMGVSAEAARKLWLRALRQLRPFLEAGDGPD